MQKRVRKIVKAILSLRNRFKLITNLTISVYFIRNIIILILNKINYKNFYSKQTNEGQIIELDRLTLKIGTNVCYKYKNILDNTDIYTKGKITSFFHDQNFIAFVQLTSTEGRSKNISEYPIDSLGITWWVNISILSKYDVYFHWEKVFNSNYSIKKD